MSPSSISAVADKAFWVVAAVLILNLNAAIWMATGAEGTLNEVLLCGSVLVLVGHPPGIGSATGRAALLLFSSLGLYLIIGIGHVLTAETSATAADWIIPRVIKNMATAAAAAGGTAAAIRLRGPERFLQGLLMLMTASSATVLFSPWLIEIWVHLPSEPGSRGSGVFENPNAAGIMACLAAAGAVATMRKQLVRGTGIPCALVAIAAAAGTFSRTAFFMLVGAGAVAALTDRRGRRVIVSLGVVTGIVGMWIAASGEPERRLTEDQIERWLTVREIVTTIAAPDGNTVDRIWGERAITLRMGWKAAAENPILGQGLGSQLELENGWTTRTGRRIGSHNTYLLLLGETGILPLGAYVGFLWMGLKRQGKGEETPLRHAARGWTVVLAIAGLADHSLLHERHWAFIMGVIAAVVTLEKR